MSSAIKRKQFDLPNGEQCVLRQVTKDDDPILLEIYMSTREAELAQVEWEPGQKEAFIHWQFVMQRQEYEQRFPDGSYEMILINEEPAGRFWTGSDDKEIRLLDIAILPQFQNRGVGTLLVSELIKEAGRAQKPLRHMVFMLNNQAERFYEKLGFVEIEDVGAYKHMEWRPSSA
jgi:GNAT superfamily N-acetyltransferase